jgi:hypothetical protein
MDIYNKLKSDYNLKLSDVDTTIFTIDKQKKTILCKGNPINIEDIKSHEIIMYFIRQMPEYYLTNRYSNLLKLSDVDTTLFTIDKKYKRLLYKDVSVNIYDIKSEEIKNYCIRQIAECYLTDRFCNFKLSDVDTTLFTIDKEKQILLYKDVTVNIVDIKSEEIRNYCINELKSAEDKDICKYIIDTLINTNRLLGGGTLIDKIKLNLELYLTLKSSQNKLYILKYVFSKYKSLTELEDKEELFKIFIGSPSFLIDLLRQMISTNSNSSLEYILKHKNVPIDRNEYKKLQDYATNLHLFELTNTLTIYESLDVILDNKIEDTDKSILERTIVDNLWN